MEKFNSRRHRIAQVLKMIIAANNEGRGVNRERLIAEIGINIGISKRTVSEYINSLILTGKVIEEKGELWSALLYKKNGINSKMS